MGRRLCGPVQGNLRWCSNLRHRTYNPDHRRYTVRPPERPSPRRASVRNRPSPSGAWGWDLQAKHRTHDPRPESPKEAVHEGPEDRREGHCRSGVDHHANDADILRVRERWGILYASHRVRGEICRVLAVVGAGGSDILSSPGCAGVGV